MRPLLCVSLCSFLVPGAAAAQCDFASVHPYDATAPNPITLTAEGPYNVPALGGTVKFVSPDAPESYLKILFAAASAGIVPVGPPLVGTVLLASPFAVSPLQTQAQWTFPVPPSTPVQPWFFQCLATNGVEFLLSNGLEAKPGAGAEIEVLSVSSVGAAPVSGEKDHAYSVTFRNNGVAPATPVIKVCVAGLCGSDAFPIDPGETLTKTILVDTVSVPFSCAGFSEPLSACSLLADCDPGNDCVTGTVLVKALYWDLSFQIIDEPSSIHVGQTAFWKVKVTNQGTVPSDNVCFINGIVLGSGAGVWSPAICGNVPQLWTGVIAPGASKTFSLSQQIWCGALLGTQWIKTEIHYSAGCFDNCPNGNFDQESIQILP